MKNRENKLYGIGTVSVIVFCIMFYHCYVHPKLPKSLEIPTSYIEGYYRDLDSMAICNGDIDCVDCFEYTLPQTYNFGYDLIMANRYKDTDHSYYFFEKLLCLTKDKKWNYFDTNVNHALDMMDDSVCIIALKQLAKSGSRIEDYIDSLKVGKYASIFDSIKNQGLRSFKRENGYE